MKAVNANALSWSKRIISFELREAKTSADIATGIEKAFKRLHGLMANLVGDTGFKAVLARAANLTASECPCLSTTTIEVDLTVIMQGLAAGLQNEGEAQARACATKLMSQVLGLLCNFIGEDLTVRLVGKVWSNLAEPSHEGR